MDPVLVQQKNRLRGLLVSTSNYANRLGQRGQVVVEYVLLLVASVTVAFMITKMMVGRDPGNPGYVISAWQAIIEEIARDKPDDIKR